MASIEVKKELPEEFLSDILITAFDGSYGACWQWFEPITGTDKFWLLTKNDTGSSSSDNPWLHAKVRLREDCLTGEPLFDTREGWIVDHDVLAHGISRIINDDYLGIWRKATEREADDFHNKAGSFGRNFRYHPKGGNVVELQIETGETARGVRDVLNRAVLDLEAGDIDADVADCIVQVGVFGKAIFS